MPKAKGQKRKHILLYLRVAVVVCGMAWVIYWFSQGQRWANLKQILGQMNPWIFAATLAVFITGQILVGFRWWLLLRTQSIFINLWAAVKLHFLGLFYNNVMPSSVGGDLIRAWYVTRHTNKMFEGALSVFVDRAIGLLSTLVIAAFFYLLFLKGSGAVVTSENQDGIFNSLAQHKGIILCATTAVLLIFGILFLFKRGRMILMKSWSLIRTHSIQITNKLRTAIFIYCRSPLTILAAFGITVFLQIMTITGFWFLGMNLGIGVSIKYYYVFFTLTWVLGAIPVSIGGVFVVEVFLASLFIKFAGVGEEAASALAFCQRAVWMLASLPGAFIHLSGAHLPKEFFVDYDKPVN